MLKILLKKNYFLNVSEAAPDFDLTRRVYVCIFMMLMIFVRIP